MGFKRGHREPNLQVHWPEKQKKPFDLARETLKKRKETYAKQAQSVRKVLCARVTVKHSWSGKWHKSQRQNNETSSGTSQIVNISADVYEDAICGNHLHLRCNWKRGVHPAAMST